MCTVTFLPLPGKNFIITSNRDERKTRPTILPMPYTIEGEKIYFPKDEEAGGTWFAVSDEFTVVVLNGADKRHERNPPYRRSRGLVMLDFYQYKDAKAFTGNYNFDNIEPFTLVIVDHNRFELHQVRWDGQKSWLETKDTTLPHIWSSATLYDEQTRLQREKWFEDWLESGKEFTVENILHFHHFGGSGNIYNDLVMNREGRVQTVSISCLEKREGKKLFWYEDLVDNRLHTLEIK